MEEIQVKKLRSKGDRVTGRLLLLSCGAVVAFEVCLMLLNLATKNAYNATGGLAGFQKRAMLDTLRFVFQDIGILLLPFWQIGVLRVALLRSRNQTVCAKDLTFGFTRIGPVLGRELLTGLILVLVLLTATNVASTIFAFTPMGMTAGEELAGYMTDPADYMAMMEKIPMDVLLKAVAPALVLAAVLGVPAMYVVGCRVRLAGYLVMEDEKIRAFPGMLTSVGMTRNQLWNFVQLDLGFWWYYLVLALVFALGYADLWLPALGVKLDANVIFYGAFALRTVLRLLVAWGLQSRVELTYAAFYEKLKPQPEKMDS